MKNITIWIITILLLSLSATYQLAAQDFTDNFNAENNGDFPSKWDLLAGSAHIDDVEGRKAVKMGDDSMITPKLEQEDYIGDSFTLQFDLFFDQVTKSVGYQTYNLRLWPGTGAGKLKLEQGTKSFRAITIKRNGSTTSIAGGGPKKEFSNYLSDLRDHEPVWRHIEVQYANSNLKLFIDDNLILIIPNYDINPSKISLEAGGQGSLTKGVTDISLKGAMPMPDYSLAENDLRTTENPENSGEVLEPARPTSTEEINNPTTTVDLAPTNTGSESKDVLNEAGDQMLPGQESTLPALEIDKEGIREAMYSGLEFIEANGKTGWRLKGMNPQNYGGIGNMAVDLSISVNGGNLKGAQGKGSVAMGNSTTSSGAYSTSMGSETKASGAMAFSAGDNTIASGSYSTAFGKDSRALSLGSVAIGEKTTAQEIGAIALGYETYSDGLYSIAMGSKTSATGDYSTAMGFETNAYSFSSLAVGRYNKSFALSPEAWIPEDPLLMVGNGKSPDDLSNALTILKNGNTGITTHKPVAKLQITGGSDASYLPNTGFLVIGETEKNNLVLDNNEIIARENGTTSTLYLQQDGGDVAVGGKVVHSSDRRLKKNVVTLNYGLKEILALAPKQYEWKNSLSGKVSLGFIAQEVQSVVPEIIIKNEGEHQMLSISYTELIPVLVRAVQQQSEIIKTYESRLKKLEQKLFEIDKELVSHDQGNNIKRE